MIRGFRDYPVRPRFRVSMPRGQKFDDIIPLGSYWLVSDRAKQVLSEISKADFAFLPIDVEITKGIEPTAYWLCDVMPLLDAVDEARSDVEVNIANDGGRVYNIAGRFSLIFDDSVVGSHYMFRLRTNPSRIICDEIIKAAFEQSGLIGLRFRDAEHPV
jgi:hypothetical protein